MRKRSFTPLLTLAILLLLGLFCSCTHVNEVPPIEKNKFMQEFRLPVPTALSDAEQNEIDEIRVNYEAEIH